ncbi:LLM class flavin-dependent oxidoreductase [Dickeya sp. CFBP 2040]|uniref:MupA/Atu3671 family FMN-dependent luciferase-like monooxygenase n=1 Tax=Dickeya sp. CFBP 2040 TaxID=2718531 RepID=UPI001447CFBD|nr:MupA/Atu3671 family FMN-dependent luciferase-like monooxygenase [Dickeya sp. CFBP 2040]NKI73722.1 LLM class flavin-dependent oxidoreductase [Dickeya sp. CFBP 2040]
MSAKAELTSSAIPKLSLFFFSNVNKGASTTQYQQLISMVQLADELNFDAIWTPERHFNAFGGMFPNPSVLSAALAASTRRISIRAGSVVLPLHDPLRVAEEWALVDNLSAGRVGVAFAAGWQRNDFVLNAGNYKNRQQCLFSSIETVLSLWSGNTVVRDELSLPGSPEPVEIQTWPAPLQHNIPVWITTGSNPLLFEEAGKRGFHVLTHLINQTWEQLEANCASYRRARAEAGHDADAGKITLMMHTQAGKSKADMLPELRPALKNYLSAFMQLSDNLSQSSSSQQRQNQKRQAYTLKWGVEKYLNQYGLFGSASECQEILVALKQQGIDEVACLIDFGMAEESVRATIDTLATLLIN